MENTSAQTVLDEKMNELSADKRELLELLLGGDRAQTETAKDEDSKPILSEVEQNLKEIWETVLSAGEIKTTDNFFELGGDSLHCIQIVAKARKQNIHFSTAELFEAQTIEKLAQKIGVKDSPQTGQNESESSAKFAESGLNDDELMNLLQRI